MSERQAAPAWRTRGPAAAQGTRGQALPPSTLLRALIRPPSRGPASKDKNRLLGHPAARAGRPRPRETTPRAPATRGAGVGPGDRREAEAEPWNPNPQADPLSGPALGAAWAAGRSIQRPPGRGLPGERAPRPAPLHSALRPAPGSTALRSSPCAARNQAGTTRWRVRSAAGSARSEAGPQ